MGGYVTKKHLKTTTHIVSNFIDDATRDRLAKVSDAQIVTFSYLKECLVARQRLPEFEYPPKKAETRPTAISGDSRNSLPNNLSRNNRGDGDHYSQTFESFLFENVLFAFHPDLKDLDQLSRKVLVHSGSFIRDAKKYHFEGRKLHYILPDGFNEAEAKALKDKYGDEGVTFLSPRWIDYCLLAKSVVKNVEAGRFINLLPFPHSTPFPSFAGLSFCLKGFDVTEKYVLAEVITILGGRVDRLDPASSTQIRIFRDPAMGEGLANVRMYPWLLGCLQAGHLTD
jgi:hypothetical protein